MIKLTNNFLYINLIHVSIIRMCVFVLPNKLKCGVFHFTNIYLKCPCSTGKQITRCIINMVKHTTYELEKDLQVLQLALCEQIIYIYYTQ